MKLQESYWVPKEDEFSYSAASFQEAQDEFNRSFLEMGWGDGLPLRSQIQTLSTAKGRYYLCGPYGPKIQYMIDPIRFCSRPGRAPAVV
jgi:hypothetical protein